LHGCPGAWTRPVTRQARPIGRSYRPHPNKVLEVERGRPYYLFIHRNGAAMTHQEILMLQNREGKRVPDVTFRVRENNDWKTVTSKELFDGKTVVVFSLPGAFTPTCSSTHLPRYNELAPVFLANGVDSILCVAVNDPFVMTEWAKDQEAQNIKLIPDGNGEFTAGMGMLVDKSDLGFGKRSWRYSMLVKNGVIEKMFIEPEKPGDPFEVSDADTMLRYINANAKLPDQVAILTREGCAFCARAKALLTELGYDYAEVPLPHTTRTKVVGAITGDKTVPQVFINGKLIGGLEALEQWARKAA
jgi:glutaredoxin-like protein